MNQRTGVHGILDEHQELLGTVPDHVVAEKAGLSLSAVGRYRRSRGIAPYQGYKFGQREGGAPVPRRRSRLEDFRDVLGVLPDKEVARRAGLTPEGVRIYRKRKGIPRRSPVGELAHLEAARTPARGPLAWRVDLGSPDGTETVVVFATDLVGASRAARSAALGREARVEQVSFVGPVLTAAAQERARRLGHG